MIPFSSTLVAQLDLGAALDAELSAERNLIPPEPWQNALVNDKQAVARWIETQATAGFSTLPNVYINARKAGQGVRPVAIMGIAERVIYRALTTEIVKELNMPERSAEEYREMLAGPIDHVSEELRIILVEQEPNRPAFIRLTNSPFKYVVEADIASFYDYIDHELLLRELQVQTDYVQESRTLISLLGQVEGRSFGIPQLLDASDLISEVYIRILERNLIRRGHLLWRYNDDFRILVREYGDALSALEQLGEAARELGLTLNDYKTRTPGINTYFAANTTLEVEDGEAGFNPEDAEVVISDYPEDDETSLTEAKLTLERLDSDNPAAKINLRSLTAEDARSLRRALSSLARLKDPSGLPYVNRLFFFVQTLTPRLCRYLLSVGDVDGSGVSATWDSLMRNDDLSDWQAIWLLYTAREALLLNGNPERSKWAESQQRRRSPVLAAEAALTLAAIGHGEIGNLDQALRLEPGVLSPWYVLAIRYLHILTPSQHSTQVVKALKESNKLFDVLLMS